MSLTFSPLQNRMADLPKVLAGPILRRTEKNSVSVWIALKEAESNLQLSILDFNTSSSGQLMLFGTASTRAFGQHLHIAVITADQTASGGGHLQHGRFYHYDITFGSSSTLSTAGILSRHSSGIDKIVYGSRSMPSFLLAASTVNNLKILHGSCRKPHGGEKDALQSVDEILSTTHDELGARPQQLMLTGDQIYADDVSDTLMYMLQDAGYTLLGWSETVPLLGPADLIAGNTDRTNFIKQTAEMSSDESKSHLIKLGEYYAMYLFVWSSELWPSSTIVEEIGDHFSFPEEETHKLLQFKRTLPNVRKALANIPSYMVFDDHEVTDDWFLNRAWSQRVLANDLGRRIIQNGLSAFAIFQDWGNKPDYYNVSGLGPVYNSGFSLLEELVQLNQNSGSNASDWQAIGDRVLPTFSGNHLTTDHTWHFAINFDSYQLLGFDTRNRRQFHGSRRTGLINWSNLADQLPNRTGSRDLTIVLSGTPIIGHTLLEETLQPLYARTLGVEAADFEAWVFHKSIFQELLRRLSTFDRVLILSGDVHYGFSCTIKYWDERSGTGSQEHRAKFVQLCSSSLKNSDFKTRLIGDNYLPVSAFFLGTFAYLGWDSTGEHIEEYRGLTRLQQVLLDVPMNQNVAALISMYVTPLGLNRSRKNFRYTPAVHRLKLGDTVLTQPKWRYRVDFMKDIRSSSARGFTTGAILQSTLTSGAMPTMVAQGADTTVVGKDNMALISFTWNSSLKKVNQTFYFAHPLGGTTNLRPYTVHELSFEIPAAGDPRPG